MFWKRKVSATIYRKRVSLKQHLAMGMEKHQRLFWENRSNSPTCKRTWGTLESGAADKSGVSIRP